MSIKWMPSSNFKTPCLIVQLNSMALWLYVFREKNPTAVFGGNQFGLGFLGEGMAWNSLTGSLLDHTC